MSRCAAFAFSMALLGAVTAVGTDSWEIVEYALLATSLALVLTVVFLLRSLDSDNRRDHDRRRGGPSDR